MTWVMGLRTRSFVLLVLALVLITACGISAQNAGGPKAPGSALAPETSSGPRGTLRIAWAGEPPTLSPKMYAGGGSAFFELAVTFNSALTMTDPTGKAVPQLASDIPTTDNGGWVINPDGTMVTTYKLRHNARWHDGAPLTAQDFAFAYRAYMDPAVPVYGRSAENFVSSVEAPDDYTLVINWANPYYRANGLHYLQLDPLPSHLLEDVYQNDVATFVNGPYWTDKYIGSGPFRVADWEPGVALRADAFTDWVLGPPKAAHLEIHFISDANTILANMLSGDLDVTAHPFFPPNLAAQLHDQWGDTGQVKVTESRMEQLDLQLREVPDWQPAVTDVRVRQALLSAIDRGSLTELLNYGLGGAVADAFFAPSDPLFPEVEQAVTKYPFDRTAALRLLADAGWQRRPPDGLLVNAAGQTFPLEIRATQGPSGEQETASIANNWKDVGVDASIYIVPRALSGDAELAANFPGGLTGNRPITPEYFAWTTNQFPTPQNRWLGSNRPSFSDPEVDRWNDAVLTATNTQALREASVNLHQRMSQVLGTLPLYYPADVIVTRNPVTGPLGHFTYPCYSWNIFEWGFADS